MKTTLRARHFDHWSAFFEPLYYCCRRMIAAFRPFPAPRTGVDEVIQPLKHVFSHSFEVGKQFFDDC